MSTPTVELISQREFARRDGCDVMLVQRAIRAGRLWLVDKKLDAALVGSGWRETNRRAGASPPVQSTPLSTHPGETPAQAADRIIAESGIPTHDRAEAERIRENYNALLRQLEYDTKSAVVVAVAEVGQIVASEYAQVRTKMLAIPAEQAPQLQRLKTVAEVQDALHRMIVEALEGLAYDGAAR